jgi:hypothetical protein
MSSGMDAVVRRTGFDEDVISVDVGSGDKWVLSFDCDTTTAQTYVLDLVMRDVMSADLGLLTSGQQFRSSPVTLESGQPYSVGFEVPADHVVSIWHFASGFGRADMHLYDSVGALIQENQRVEDSYTNRLSVNLRHRSDAAESYTVVYRPSEPIQDVEIVVEATPTEDIGTVAAGDSFHVDFPGNVADGEQTVRVDLADDAIIAIDAPESYLRGNAELIDPTTGEVVSSQDLQAGITLPAEAGTWLLRVQANTYQALSLSADVRGAAVTNEPLRTPPYAHEAVQRHLSVSNCPQVSAVSAVIEQGSTSTRAHIALTSPGGTRVVLADEASRYSGTPTLLRLPEDGSFESLEAFDGENGSGDWTVALYGYQDTSTTIENFALELECQP